MENWTSGAYAYDGACNIARIGSDHFHYDQVGRLVEGSARGAGDRLARYGYDAFGNLTSMRNWVNGVEQSGGPDLTTNAATNRFASSATATYDAFGNQTSWVGGVRTAGWDSMQMMATHSDGVNGWDYFYTADDERIGVRRASTGQYDWFLRDLGGKVLRQYTDAAWVKDYVYRDGSLLAAVDASGTRHFHLDHLGTPRLITGVNRIATGHAYWPFCEEATSVTVDSERMKFTGHERDLNGGTLTGNNNYLDYMHARYYSPVMGRFLSVDPKMQTERALGNPQQWNRYTYSLNNPLKYVDPDGRDVTLIVRAPGESATNFGHVAIRVHGKGYDRTYDFGRYGRTWGFMKSKGEGILRVWSNNRAFMAGQQKKGDVRVLEWQTSSMFDKTVMTHFNEKIRSGEQINSTSNYTEHKLPDEYKLIGNNCTTICMTAVAEGVEQTGARLEGFEDVRDENDPEDVYDDVGKLKEQSQ